MYANQVYWTPWHLETRLGNLQIRWCLWALIKRRIGRSKLIDLLFNGHVYTVHFRKSTDRVSGLFDCEIFDSFSLHYFISRSILTFRSMDLIFFLWTVFKLIFSYSKIMCCPMKNEILSFWWNAKFEFESRGWPYSRTFDSLLQSIILKATEHIFSQNIHHIEVLLISKCQAIQMHSKLIIEVPK